jgi:hypothetical protein
MQSVHRGKLVVSLKAREVERRVCQEGIRNPFEKMQSASVREGEV